MMFLQVLPLSGLLHKAPSRLDIIADFAPFFMMGVALFLLGLAVATAIYDSWWVRRKTGAAAAQQDHARTAPCMRLACSPHESGQPAQ
jgi:hypothetical protein